MKWVREFNGGQYTSADGRAVLSLRDRSGKFKRQKRYVVRVDGAALGSRRLLADAKALALEAMNPK
jgi:hypothetical protein